MSIFQFHRPFNRSHCSHASVRSVPWSKLLFLAIAATVLGVPTLVHASTPDDVRFHAATTSAAEPRSVRPIPAIFSECVDNTSMEPAPSKDLLRYKLLYLQ